MSAQNAIGNININKSSSKQQFLINNKKIVHGLNCSVNSLTFFRPVSHFYTKCDAGLKVAKRQPHKMVKHTQTICRQTADKKGQLK